MMISVSRKQYQMINKTVTSICKIIKSKWKTLIKQKIYEEKTDESHHQILGNSASGEGNTWDEGKVEDSPSGLFRMTVFVRVWRPLRVMRLRLVTCTPFTRPPTLTSAIKHYVRKTSYDNHH